MKQDTEARKLMRDNNWELAENPSIYAVAKTRGDKTTRTAAMTMDEARAKMQFLRECHKGYFKLEIVEVISIGQIK